MKFKHFVISITIRGRLFYCCCSFLKPGSFLLIHIQTFSCPKRMQFYNNCPLRLFEQCHKFPISILVFFHVCPSFSKRPLSGMSLVIQGQDSVLPMQGARVRSLVRNLDPNKGFAWVSLMVQWLRNCLAMQVTLAQFLVWEYPTCHGATKPVHHSYRACALEPMSGSTWGPHALESMLHKSSHCKEKPTHHN